jgi:hypothetical protein
MTQQNDFVQKAKQAGFAYRSIGEGAGVWVKVPGGNGSRLFAWCQPELEMFANLIRQQALEEAAKVAERKQKFAESQLEDAVDAEDIASWKAEAWACKSIANEILALIQQPASTPVPMCEECGDSIVPHDPGICGTCYAIKYAQPATQEADARDAELKALQKTEAPQLRKIHPLDLPLEVFLADLTTRPANIIRAELAGFASYAGTGIFDIEPPFTVRHLCMFSRSEMRKWPNFGRKCLNEVEEMLRARGLQLWENHDERSLRLLREHKEYFK